MKKKTLGGVVRGSNFAGAGCRSEPEPRTIRAKLSRHDEVVRNGLAFTASRDAVKGKPGKPERRQKQTRAHSPASNFVGEGSRSAVPLSSPFEHPVFVLGDIGGPEVTPDGDHLVLESQGRVFRICSSECPAGAGGDRPRGDRKAIREFSNRSRNAMLERLNRMDVDNAGAMLAITLTYPPESWTGARDSKEHLERFWKRLQRKAWAEGRDPWQVWKMEAHKRHPAMHYHLLVSDLEWLSHAWIRDTWREIIGATRPTVVYVQAIDNSRHAVVRYVSKYCAKPTDAAAAAWRLDGSASLVSSTNSDAESSGAEFTGRFWGIMGRSNVPWARCTRCQIRRGTWSKRVKRLARRFMASERRAETGRRSGRIRGYSNGKPGFRVLTDSAEKWAEAVTEAVAEELREPFGLTRQVFPTS